MSRKLCENCHRPIKSCICAFTTPISNSIHVVILQHPSEVSHAKNTITLLEKSLRSCEVIVGESFLNNERFHYILDNYNPVLLYPSEHAKIITEDVIKQYSFMDKSKANTKKPCCLVLLDGTWKKAYKMYRLSEKVLKMPHVCLPEYLASAGQYSIRKVAKKNALSSVEACSYALALLEQPISNNTGDGETVVFGNAGKYQALLEKFEQFNEFQLSFRPQNESSNNLSPKDT